MQVISHCKQAEESSIQKGVTNRWLTKVEISVSVTAIPEIKRETIEYMYIRAKEEKACWVWTMQMLVEKITVGRLCTTENIDLRENTEMPFSKGLSTIYLKR